MLSLVFHDDIIKWKHFPRYWPFVRGIHRSPVNSPHKGQWRGALMFSLICAWTNRDVGDLRRHRDCRSFNSSPPPPHPTPHTPRTGKMGRHFRLHFHEWTVLYFESTFAEQYLSIGSDNGLAPIRRQAIIWTNANQVHWRIYNIRHWGGGGGGGGGLNNVAKLCHMSTYTWVTIGSDNGFPGAGSVTLNWNQFHRKFLQCPFAKWVWKYTCVKFPRLSGANDSTQCEGFSRMCLSLVQQKLAGHMFGSSEFKCM